MSKAAYYLLIPYEYSRALDGLHWVASADALEFADGTTFALAAEVSAFVEGFASRRSPIHFCLLMHLLCLLKQSRRRTRNHDFDALHRAYVQAGRLTRLAGAFAAGSA
jgi:hypothetical protein